MRRRAIVISGLLGFASALVRPAFDRSIPSATQGNNTPGAKGFIQGIELAKPASAAASFVRLGYVVNYDNANTHASVRASSGKLDFAALGLFSMSGAGDILGQHNEPLASLSRQIGAKLVPMIQNREQYAAFAPVLNNPTVRTRAITNLLTLVDQQGYDGLNIDFEALRPEDRDGLSVFLAELSTGLHSRGKISSVAVASRVGESTGVWAAPYDYRALGQSCDYVVVMSYAFRTPTNGQPGSISPLAQVEAAAAYTASQVSPSKVLLGIGLWGYDWNLSAGGRATARSYDDIQGIAIRNSFEKGFDTGIGSAWLKYTENNNRHEVWYEDSRSVEMKSQVAQRFGFAGVAYWRLGQEDSGIWSGAGASVPPPSPASDRPDYDIANGHFFSQTGGRSGYGYVVSDNDGPRFWSEFRRLGAIGTLGYPLSRCYAGSDGFVYQAFQRGLLQWRPEIGQAYLANTFEMLSAAGKDEALSKVGIPLPITDDGSGGDWNRALEKRLSWLTDPAIKAKFLAAPSGALAKSWSQAAAIQLYGLPASRPEKSGPFIVQRFQRMALQLWVESAPNMPAKGTVVGILGGELLKEHGLVPSDATQPEPGP